MENPTLEETQYIPISNEYLIENFINDGPNTAQNLFIDMDKVDFRSTPFDKHYYKKKFPLFDDSICEILEKCSIGKQQKVEENECLSQKLRGADDFIIHLD
tara:strand:- start:164 stop:466 length:303 start_codon:yes stop_codon:yes gene_type:complete